MSKFDEPRSHYLGYEVLTKYLDSRKPEEWSYDQFLTLHRDAVLVAPPFSDDWSSLDGTWLRRFCWAAEERCDKFSFRKMMKPGNRMYWNNIILERSETETRAMTRVVINNEGMNTLGVSIQAQGWRFRKEITTEEHDVEERNPKRRAITDDGRFVSPDPFIEPKISQENPFEEQIQFGVEGKKQVIRRASLSTSEEEADEGRESTVLINGSESLVESQDENLDVNDENRRSEESGETSPEIRALLTKIGTKKTDYRLFEYCIVNLAEHNLADAVHAVFTASDRALMKELWKAGEPTPEQIARTCRKSKWDRMIKPLVDKYSSAMKCRSVFDDDADSTDQEVILEKPFEGKFIFKTHYDLLWIRDIYQRFMLLFASPSNILRDPTTSEIKYRECFVNPIIIKVFDDLMCKITFNSGEIESEFRKRQRNETNSQKSRVSLGPKHDGILTVHVNAKSMEVGFLEVVGDPMNYDLTKCAEDKEKLFKAMQVSIFYQRQHHRERGAREDQIQNIQSFGILVYQRDVTIYSMHRAKGGLHVVDIIKNFTIPDSADQAYILEKIVNKVYFFKSRLMDYYIALQEISPKMQDYKVSSEHPPEASPSKTRHKK